MASNTLNLVNNITVSDRQLFGKRMIIFAKIKIVSLPLTLHKRIICLLKFIPTHIIVIDYQTF